MNGMEKGMPGLDINNLFTAQSIWDDTMAYETLEISRNLDHPFVIIVGSFHVEYKLGLPSRVQ